MADKFVEGMLKSWGLPFLVPSFREGKIDSAAFKCLTDYKISKLIEGKDDQFMFKSKYEEYKILMMDPISDEIKPEEVDITIVDVDDSQPNLETHSSSFDIEFILQESLAGRDIIKSYDAIGKLDLDISESLVNTLIYYLISQSDDFSIEKEVLNEIADAIITRFPNEKKEKYYQCNGEQVMGALVDCYYHVRRRLQRKERLKKRRGGNALNQVNEETDLNYEKIPCIDVNAEESQKEVKRTSHWDCLLDGLPRLLAQEKFVDTTLVCEGQSIKCHKIVLASYSTYFEKILESSPSNHPVLVMADLEFWEIQAIINFMYTGELDLEKHKLTRFLEIGTKLKVKGLLNTNIEDIKSVNETANIDEEICDVVILSKEEVKDPLSDSPTSSTRASRKRKQYFQNGLEPMESVTICTSSDNQLFDKDGNCSTDTEKKRSKEDDEEFIPEGVSLSNAARKHKLESIPGNQWPYCASCYSQGLKRYTRYRCSTCDVALHHRCFYNGHRKLPLL